MNLKENSIEIIKPISRFYLYGFKEYFNSFVKLLNKNSLPNAILLSGAKGIGKSTFIYHFINYILSREEKNSYSIENLSISEKNNSFKLINENMHPNFFLLDNVNSSENIKIENVRKLLNFINKSTYSKNLKIVFIDNSENLNINSSNALLKTLEEPPNNTYFFINHNNSTFLKDTIKSRCVNFNIHFSINQKKEIFTALINEYNIKFEENYSNVLLSFLSPGIILSNITNLNDLNFNSSNDLLSCIMILIEKLNQSKDSNLFNFLNLFIEKFYYDLSLNDTVNINYYFFKKSKILYLINDMKRYNLDKKNLLLSITNILQSEKK